MFRPFAGAELADPARPGSRSFSCRLTDLSTIGQARRLAGAIGSQAGLDNAVLASLGLVVSELAHNAVKHAGGGELVIRVLASVPHAGVEVLCLDRGRGIPDVAESLRDGFSTTGTMGTGLGAVRRLAQEFDIYSGVGQGTAVVARLHPGMASVAARPARAAGLALPVADETVSGDAWAARSSGTRTVVLLVDGLGHGSGAAEAANVAIRLFHAYNAEDLAALMTALSKGLHATRGAAAALADIDVARGELRYIGVGNIAARIVSGPTSHALVSHNGIVGHPTRTLHVLTYPWPRDAMLVMHSDGITNHWKPDTYPGLFRRDPALVAGVLYRDHSRERDDRSVLACRQTAGP